MMPASSSLLGRWRWRRRTSPSPPGISRRGRGGDGGAGDVFDGMAACGGGGLAGPSGSRLCQRAEVDASSEPRAATARRVPRADLDELGSDNATWSWSPSSARTTLLGVGARARLKSTREPIGQEKTGSSRRAALAQQGPGGDGNLGVGLAECDLSRALALAPRPFLNNGLSMCNSAGGKSLIFTSKYRSSMLQS